MEAESLPPRASASVESSDHDRATGSPCVQLDRGRKDVGDERGAETQPDTFPVDGETTVQERRHRIGCLLGDCPRCGAAVDRGRRHLRLGLADCALVVLAQRYETTRLLTFDERHFRTVTPLGGGSFTLLPADG